MKQPFLLILGLFIFVGCSSSDKYVDIVKNSPYFLTSETNEAVFDKCFEAHQFTSYRDKHDKCIYVSMKGKFIYQEAFHSAEVLYQFTDKEHFTVTEFYIDNQSEPEVMFMYYMAQLYTDQTTDVLTE